jgi:hypothetical protein
VLSLAAADVSQRSVMNTATGHTSHSTAKNIVMATITFQPVGTTVSSATPAKNTATSQIATNTT